MFKKIRTYSNDERLISERRKQIVKAATRLFVKHGYQRTNTRELCNALGMSKGTLYHYVGTKADILYLVLKFALEDRAKLIERLKEETEHLSVTEAIRVSIAEYFANVDELQDMYNFINHAIVDLPKNDRSTMFDAFQDMVTYFENLIKKGINNGEFVDNNPTLVAHNIVLEVTAWAHQRWFLRKRVTFEEYMAYEIDHVLHTLLPVQVSLRRPW